MEADGVAARPTARPVLNEIAPFARSEDAQAEACEIVVPDEVVRGARCCSVDDTLGELRHSQVPAWNALLPRKHHGSRLQEIDACPGVSNSTEKSKLFSDSSRISQRGERYRILA